MGIENDPEQPPIDIGADCLICYPTGESPLYLYAMVSGVITNLADFPAIPVFPNGYYRLENVSSCQWVIGAIPWSLAFDAGSPKSLFSIVHIPPVDVFTGLGDSPCGKSFTNTIVYSPTTLYYGGSVLVYGTVPPITLTWTQNFVPFEDAKNELWDLGGADSMQRVVRGKDNTNVIAKVVTENT